MMSSEVLVNDLGVGPQAEYESEWELAFDIDGKDIAELFAKVELELRINDILVLSGGVSAETPLSVFKYGTEMATRAHVRFDYPQLYSHAVVAIAEEIAEKLDLKGVVVRIVDGIPIRRR
jgi:hypothetical protein